MVRFTIFGIQVEIQPWFWITMVLLGAGFGRGLEGTPAEMLQIALFVIAGFISILVHELGHALTVKGFGARPYIVLQAFGGYAAYPSGIMSRWQSFLITAGGPAAQLFLALVIHVAMGRLSYLMNQNIFYFFWIMRWISVHWALLNLLPIYPLDGGQLMNAVLGPRRFKITLWVTIVVAASVGAYMLYASEGRSIFFPIFMGSFAWQAAQMLKERR